MNSENCILGCDVEKVKNVDIGEQLSGVSMVIKCVRANTSKPSSNQDRVGCPVSSNHIPLLDTAREEPYAIPV